METTPTQFVDPSVYLWNISNNGQLKKLEGFVAPPLRRAAHCADYATVRQQVGPRRFKKKAPQVCSLQTALNFPLSRWMKSRRSA